MLHSHLGGCFREPGALDPERWYVNGSVPAPAPTPRPPPHRPVEALAHQTKKELCLIKGISEAKVVKMQQEGEPALWGGHGGGGVPA